MIISFLKLCLVDLVNKYIFLAIYDSPVHIFFGKCGKHHSLASSLSTTDIGILASVVLDRIWFIFKLILLLLRLQFHLFLTSFFHSIILLYGFSFKYQFQVVKKMSHAHSIAMVWDPTNMEEWSVSG